MWLERLKPAVPRTWLVVLAGLMWSAVGIMLCRLAYGWFRGVRWSLALPLALLGIAMALVAYRAGFAHLARKNLRRLELLPERACLFAFQSWSSYPLVGFMIALGLVLRHSPLPKHYLAVVYTTIGGALFLSSLHYYGRLVGVQKYAIMTVLKKNAGDSSE